MKITVSSIAGPNLEASSLLKIEKADGHYDVKTYVIPFHAIAHVRKHTYLLSGEHQCDIEIALLSGVESIHFFGFKTRDPDYYASVLNAYDEIIKRLAKSA